MKAFWKRNDCEYCDRIAKCYINGKKVCEYHFYKYKKQGRLGIGRVLSECLICEVPFIKRKTTQKYCSNRSCGLEAVRLMRTDDKHLSRLDIKRKKRIKEYL